MINQTTLEIINLFIYALFFISCIFTQKDILYKKAYYTCILFSFMMYSNDALFYTIGCVNAVIGITMNVYMMCHMNELNYQE